MSFTPLNDNTGALRYESFEQYLNTISLRYWYVSKNQEFIIKPLHTNGAWCVTDREVGYLSGIWDTTFAPNGDREWKYPVGWRTWAIKYPHLRLEVLPQIIGEPMPAMMLSICYEFIKWRLENGI
jgi:hypothetical protein